MRLQDAPAAEHHLDLVRAFPLRPVRSTAGHDEAIAAIKALADRRGDRGPEVDFLVLAPLRDETARFSRPTCSPGFAA